MRKWYQPGDSLDDWFGPFRFDPPDKEEIEDWLTNQIAPFGYGWISDWSQKPSSMDRMIWVRDADDAMKFKLRWV